MDDHRQCLENGQRLYLSDEKSCVQKKCFEITSVIGKGASVICYNALIHEKNGETKSVRLKEYYPIWMKYAKRKKGILYPTGEVEEFREESQKYYSAYNKIQNKIAFESDHEVLNNYIQDVTALYGEPCEHYEDIGPRYFKSTAFFGETFEDYLHRIRKDPEQNMLPKLREILEIIVQIVRCANVLHNAGYVHQDLKPANFLVQYEDQSKRNIDSHKVSLFDTDSIIYIWGNEGLSSQTVGTEGFCPKDSEVDTWSDVWSIGAILYYALSILNDQKVFQQEQYNELPELTKKFVLVKKTPLVSSSRNAKKFYHMLTKVLRGCLLEGWEDRWSDCGELEKKLDFLIEIVREEEKKATCQQYLKKERALINEMLSKHLDKSTLEEIRGKYEILTQSAKENRVELDILLDYAKFLIDYLNAPKDAIRIVEQLDALSEDEYIPEVVKMRMFSLLGDLQIIKHKVESYNHYQEEVKPSLWRLGEPRDTLSFYRVYKPEVENEFLLKLSEHYYSKAIEIGEALIKKYNKVYAVEYAELLQKIATASSEKSFAKKAVIILEDLETQEPGKYLFELVKSYITLSCELGCWTKKGNNYLEKALRIVNLCESDKNGMSSKDCIEAYVKLADVYYLRAGQYKESLYCSRKAKTLLEKKGDTKSKQYMFATLVFAYSTVELDKTTEEWIPIYEETLQLYNTLSDNNIDNLTILALMHEKYSRLMPGRSVLVQLDYSTKLKEAELLTLENPEKHLDQLERICVSLFNIEKARGNKEAALQVCYTPLNICRKYACTDSGVWEERLLTSLSNTAEKLQELDDCEHANTLWYEIIDTYKKRAEDDISLYGHELANVCAVYASGLVCDDKLVVALYTEAISTFKKLISLNGPQYIYLDKIENCAILLTEKYAHINKQEDAVSFWEDLINYFKYLLKQKNITNQSFSAMLLRLGKKITWSSGAEICLFEAFSQYKTLLQINPNGEKIKSEYLEIAQSLMDKLWYSDRINDACCVYEELECTIAQLDINNLEKDNILRTVRPFWMEFEMDIFEEQVAEEVCEP